jgi:hypothetical protein
MYPVEQRWHPFEDTRDYGLNERLADGVDELWRGNAAGDILVFLPGEREIPRGRRPPAQTPGAQPAHAWRRGAAAVRAPVAARAGPRFR